MFYLNSKKKVYSPIPTADSFLAFCKLKRWTVQESSDFFHFLSPPASLRAPKDYTLRIPHQEGDGMTYVREAYYAILNFARIYDLPEALLGYALSKPPVEMKKMVQDFQKDTIETRRYVARMKKLDEAYIQKMIEKQSEKLHDETEEE